MEILKHIAVKGAACIAMLCMVCSGSAHAEEMESREYPIIAAYMYNFTQFTTWPKTALNNGFSLCILGRDKFGNLLDPLKNKTAMELPILVRRFASADPAIATCDVLFVSDSEENIKPILAGLRNIPVLTMSNREDFNENGGMVEYKKENTKISIHINLRAVQGAGLTISSKLLGLAHLAGE